MLDTLLECHSTEYTSNIQGSTQIIVLQCGGKSCEMDITLIQ